MYKSLLSLVLLLTMLIPCLAQQPMGAAAPELTDSIVVAPTIVSYKSL